MTVRLFQEIEIQKIRVSAQEKYILDLYNNFIKHWAWDGLEIKAVVVAKSPELPQYILEQTSASPLYKPKESIIPKVLGYLEIIPTYLHSTNQYDIRLVCIWPPVRSFWEKMAHHLQPENLYKLPKHLMPTGPWYQPPQSLVLPEKPPSPQEQIEAPTILQKDLATQGYLKPLPNTIEDAIRNRLENPALHMGKYGRNRTISENEVKEAIRRCENYVDRGGTTSDFYREALDSEIRKGCDLETFRGWIKRFGDPEKHKRKKRKAKN